MCECSDVCVSVVTCVGECSDVCVSVVTCVCECSDVCVSVVTCEYCDVCVVRTVPTVCLTLFAMIRRAISGCRDRPLMMSSTVTPIG